MSKTAPTANQLSDEIEGTIYIVASRYNSEYTNAMVASAEETLQRLAPQIEVKTIRVPGAFEIPLPVIAVSDQDNTLAVIALGVIIRGATAHADLIAQSITHQLHEISVNTLVPVIHEVLLLDNLEQAEARTKGEELNRGREAAEAAVEMIMVMDQLADEEEF